jgi:membrane protein
VLVPGKKTLGWKDFGKALKTQWADDKGSDFAASVTYYGLLAIFPFLLFVVSLASVIIDPKEAQQLIQQLSSVAPQAATQILGGRIQALAANKSGGLLTLGVIGALWASAGGVVALMRALNVVYDVEEQRPFWKVRLIALGMTLFAGIFSVVSALVMVAAGPVANAIGGPIGTLILWLRFPVAALLMMLIWAVLYYVLPDVKQRFRFLTFGSLVGVIAWLAASFGFSLYVSHFGKYDATYGTLGGVIVLLIWMYLSSTVLLMGAEMNAVLEQASPEGKRPGAKSMADTGTEPVPGAKGPLDTHARPSPSHAGKHGERQPREAHASRRHEPRREHRAPATKHSGDEEVLATRAALPPVATVPRRRSVSTNKPAWFRALGVGVAAGLAGFLYTRRA